jgi:hypothetical protein
MTKTRYDDDNDATAATDDDDSGQFGDTDEV